MNTWKPEQNCSSITHRTPPNQIQAPHSPLPVHYMAPDQGNPRHLLQLWSHRLSCSPTPTQGCSVFPPAAGAIAAFTKLLGALVSTSCRLPMRGVHRSLSWTHCYLVDKWFDLLWQWKKKKKKTRKTIRTNCCVTANHLVSSFSSVVYFSPANKRSSLLSWSSPFKQWDSVFKHNLKNLIELLLNYLWVTILNS